MITFARRHKQAIIISSITLFLVTAVAIQGNAAYTVHDPKVYAQIAKQIQKATEMINRIKEQIDIQKKNMESLKAEWIDPITSEVALITSSYNDLKSNMMSVISGTKSTAEAYKEAFQDFKNLDLKNTTYTTINQKVSTNRATLEKANEEITTLISRKQDELNKSNQRIEKLRALIPKSTSQKAISDLQAQIELETITSGNIASEITSLKTKQDAIKIQVEKLEKDAAEAMKKKTGQDFKDTAKSLEQAGTNKMVTSQSDTFYKLSEQKGWW